MSCPPHLPYRLAAGAGARLRGAMTKWQHCELSWERCELFDYGIRGATIHPMRRDPEQRDLDDLAALRRQFAALGHTGWELVGVTAPAPGAETYYFKRPVPRRP